MHKPASPRSPGSRQSPSQSPRQCWQWRTPGIATVNTAALAASTAVLTVPQQSSLPAGPKQPSGCAGVSEMCTKMLRPREAEAGSRDGSRVTAMPPVPVLEAFDVDRALLQPLQGGQG